MAYTKRIKVNFPLKAQRNVTGFNKYTVLGEKSGVYEVTCTCDSKYIEMMKRHRLTCGTRLESEE